MTDPRKNPFLPADQQPTTAPQVSFRQLLEDIEAAVAVGGRGAEFIRRAYLSYYRPDVPVNLYDALRLDGRNYNLLCRMLRIRQMPNWSDEEMFQLEQRLKRVDDEDSSD